MTTKSIIAVMGSTRTPISKTRLPTVIQTVFATYGASTVIGVKRTAAMTPPESAKLAAIAATAIAAASRGRERRKPARTKAIPGRSGMSHA